MPLTEPLLAIVVIAGLVVALAGYNLFRYSVIIMGGVGGFFLGNMLFSDLLSGLIGEGILHDMNGSAGASFVVAVVMLVTAALAYALYNIMAPIIAGVGGGFMFVSLMALSPYSGIVGSVSGFFLGLIVGIALGLAAVYVQRWAAIVFTALCGARIVAYAGAKLLMTYPVGTAIGNPVASMFKFVDTGVALELALFLELFVFISVVGIIVQNITRAD
ncbi:MAG: TMEM198/TM7SF3 family protein [Saccharofermentans sp.]|nr:TMEM198/TM7SF3 family protein [Saccharofermentans sp.]